MIDRALAVDERPLWREYFELTKPRVVSLLTFTALVGMCLASPGWPPPDATVFGLIGISLGAAAGGAINHLIDQRADALMTRTRDRPLPKGRIERGAALAFALGLCAVSMLVLVVFVNPLTAWLTLGAMVGYSVVYTMYLKRATPQNIVIGGAAGAMPPVLGWTAVTNSLDAQALLLFSHHLCVDPATLLGARDSSPGRLRPSRDPDASGHPRSGVHPAADPALHRRAVRGESPCRSSRG